MSKSKAITLSEPRLPYHPITEEKFGIDKSQWIALVDAVFPNAGSTESVLLALHYCRARNLDPFKRCVHIVAIWSAQKKRLVDSVWPGIGELRTTASRTGKYAGRSECEFGEMLTQKVGNVEMTFPEWARVTVTRIVAGVPCEFVGPKVYWLETYAKAKRDDDTPNSMWRQRVRGQLEKCAEAAALRAAFPEEIGSEYCADEIQSYPAVDAVSVRNVNKPGELTARLTAPAGDPDVVQPDPPEDINQESDPFEQARVLLQQATTERQIKDICAKFSQLVEEEADAFELNELAKEHHERVVTSGELFDTGGAPQG